MDLISLILYGFSNIAMVLYCLRSRGDIYKFPFWVGMISLGWFFPQAIGGYVNVRAYPEHAYTAALLFATICNIALWIGFEIAQHRVPRKPSWLDAPFDEKKLYYAGAVLCVFGFFFQLKLQSLPEEMLAASQWSGPAVKYLFFANIFKLGFITLWLLYLSQTKILVPRYLIFIIPCLMLFLEAIVLRGRRAGMMNLTAYMLMSLWFVRRISIPRWLVIAGVVGGLIFINSIGTYRAIMGKKELDLSERLSMAANADYMEASKKKIDESGSEFNNYLFLRLVHADTGLYDYGITHWNKFVFNYVPAQIVGKEFKESLELDPTDISFGKETVMRYGHKFAVGSTATGYKDAFGSFGWFGFIKFFLIGTLMGAIYRHGMRGAFLGQLLYIYFLTKGMQSVSHNTNDILVRVWVYFFALGYPVLFWARIRGRGNEDGSTTLLEA